MGIGIQATILLVSGIWFLWYNKAIMITRKPHGYIQLEQENKTFGRKSYLSHKKLLGFGCGYLTHPRWCEDCGKKLFPCPNATFRCKECQYKAQKKKAREVYSKTNVCKNCGKKTTLRSKGFCKVCDNKIRPRGIAKVWIETHKNTLLLPT
jgi:hypothetical protein